MTLSFSFSLLSFHFSTSYLLASFSFYLYATPASQLARPGIFDPELAKKLEGRWMETSEVLQVILAQVVLHFAI